MESICSECGKQLNEGAVCECQKGKPLVAQVPGYFTEENYYYSDTEKEPSTLRKFFKKLFH